MSCMQYFLNYFGQNKEYRGLLQLFSVKFIFLDKAMNSGKNVKIRDFHYFLFEPIKFQNDCTDNGADLCKIFNLSANRKQ